MKTSVKRILSALCIVSLSVTLFSGCSENPEDYSIISEIVFEDDNNSSGNSNSNVESNKDDSASKSQNNNSKNNNPGKDSAKTPSTAGDSTKVNPADYKGTTVTYAMWQRADGIDTQTICNNFKNKYGITVKILNVAQSTYIQEITSLISSGNAPDVIKDCDFWPEFISIAQPLENAKMDLSDSMWNQEFLKQSEVNGKHYSIRNTSKGTTLVYYNKKLLQNNAIRTPEEYKAIGQWNFEALTTIMQKVAALGKSYVGGYFADNGYVLYPCFNTSIFKYKDGKFSTGINDSAFLEISKYMAEWNKQGLLSNVRSAFYDGKAGIAVEGTYGLRKTGYWKDMNYSDIGYIEVPSLNGKDSIPATTWQGHGICKGAKNPVAAGIFLSYYLTEDNQDSADSFITQDAYKYQLSLNKNTTGVYTDIRTGIYGVLGSERNVYTRQIVSTDPAQIPALISSLNNQVNAYVKKVQDFYDSAIKSN